VSRLRRLRVKPFREMDPVPIGIVALVGMVILLLLSFNISKLPFTSGTGYRAAFAEAEGLRPGDQVMIGGVVVGKVTSVGLEGTHVKVGFSITHGGVRLGSDTTASIQIATLLGNKYLALVPKGPGQWPASRELPTEATATSYDVEPAFQGLARTTGAIDTKQLAAALDTMATTFRNSPASVRLMLHGLSRLSRTIASRNAELGQLLQHTDALTQVLAQRKQDITGIFGSGDQLLTMLQQRQAVIRDLLDTTTQLATQLTGLVQDNQASIGPALAHLHGVLALLNSHQADLDTIIKGLYVFIRGEVDATGNGPWFDGTAINATNPFQLHAAGATPTSHPRTLGDLLGVPAAERVLAGGHR
jgi:phospholipid/cholesterol/gamma-HCH transport system substrate-binding protein